MPTWSYTVAQSNGSMIKKLAFTFNVASFTEVVALQEGDIGSRTVMTLVIRLAYTDSLSELIPLFKDMNFTSFSINERPHYSVL